MYIDNEDEYQRAIDQIESMFLKPPHLRDDESIKVLKEAIIVYEEMYLDNEDQDDRLLL